MVNDFWLKNKHTISIFQAQVRDLAKHIEAQPKKNNAYKKNVYKGKCFYGKTYVKETIKNNHTCSNKHENYKQNFKPAKYFQDNSTRRSAHKILSPAELRFR